MLLASIASATNFVCIRAYWVDAVRVQVHLIKFTCTQCVRIHLDYEMCSVCSDLQMGTKFVEFNVSIFKLSVSRSLLASKSHFHIRISIFQTQHYNYNMQKVKMEVMKLVKESNDVSVVCLYCVLSRLCLGE